MKPIYPLLALTILLVGCSAEEPAPAPKPNTAGPVPAIDALSIAVPATPPPGVAPHTAVPSAETKSVPLLTDGDKRAELADLTEKVYLKWNAALASYKKQHSSLPGNLDELQKFQPDLGTLQIPPGFKLQYDTQAGEIYIVHATPNRPGNVANNQSGVRPPPPVIR